MEIKTVQFYLVKLTFNRGRCQCLHMVSQVSHTWMNLGCQKRLQLISAMTYHASCMHRDMLHDIEDRDQIPHPLCMGIKFPTWDNLVPRVLWLFGQRIGASRDSGVLEFCYRKISAVKQWKSLQGSQSKNLIVFKFPRVYWCPSADQKSRGLWVQDCTWEG